MKYQFDPVRAPLRMLTAALLAMLPMLATAAETTDSAPLEEVVITGSRIASANSTSASPIQVVTSKDIQLSGKSDISDIINQLPQNFNNDLGQDLGNRTSGLTTAGGVATADLRGLGPHRTLVLVDGRRLGVGSPYTAIQSPAPDLDQIPAALVDHVEVVTGGASATYGSDAIAGVVNFIMKKNYEGLQIDSQVSENWHQNHNRYAQSAQRAAGQTPLGGSVTDGQMRNFNLTFGANFNDGKGNVSGYLGYLSADPVRSGDRDFGGCQLGINATLDGADCNGSSNSNYFRPHSGPNANSGPFSVSGDQFVPRGSVVTDPPASFNSQTYIYMSRGDVRYTAGFMAHNEISEGFKPYAELSFMNDRTHQEVAPSALFRTSNPNDPSGAGDYYVNCSNPLLSAQQAALLCSAADIAADAANPGSRLAQVEIGRRNTEGGGRMSDYEHTNYRGVIGARGALGKDWSYDAYGQLYYTSFYNSNERYLNFTNIDKSLLVTGTAANPVCISGPPCVPYNIFKDGGVTQQALNYLYLDGTGFGSTRLKTVHADLTGNLGSYGLKLPTAVDGLAVNVGYEHRGEQLKFKPDSGELSGQLSGFGSAAVALDRGVEVSEGFAELRVPLLQGRRGAHNLVADVGYRSSDYSTSGRVGTYKLDLQYAPIDSLRLRGSFQHAIRAPSIVELYNPQNVGLIQSGNDPCAATVDAQGNVVPAVRSLNDCLHTVSAAQAAQFTQLYGNGGTTNLIPQGVLGQLSQLTGGNPALQPEKAESWSAGLTFAPASHPNFNGSIDWYRIRLKDEVNVVAANLVLSNCLDNGDPTYCQLIVRSPSTLGLVGNSIASGGYIVQTNVNVTAAEVSGIDVQAGYKLPLPRTAGTLAFALNGAFLQSATNTAVPGAHTYDCAGLFGSTCQTVNPRWHHILRATWIAPRNFNASLTWRHIGAVGLDNNDPDPSLQFASFAGYNSFNARIPAYNYLDLAATWTHGNLELRGGVNNITDKDPPLATFEIVSGGAPNTYSTYDALGRQMFVALSWKL